jgi:futalosine hydrolase
MFYFHLTTFKIGAVVITMILVVAATEMELRPFIKAIGSPDNGWQSLVGGVGPLETATRLGRLLAIDGQRIDCVFNLGVGGAYIPPQPQKMMELLSVCLAEREIVGDFGICQGNEMEYFPENLSGDSVFLLDKELMQKAGRILAARNISYYSGTFVTVNSVSGRETRGSFLQKAWNGICENMEGAAIARVCCEYCIPFVEMRVISNLVEDRNPAKWRLQEACERAGQVGAMIVKELI